VGEAADTRYSNRCGGGPKNYKGVSLREDDSARRGANHQVRQKKVSPTLMLPIVACNRPPGEFSQISVLSLPDSLPIGTCAVTGLPPACTGGLALWASNKDK